MSDSDSCDSYSSRYKTFFANAEKMAEESAKRTSKDHRSSHLTEHESSMEYQLPWFENRNRSYR